MKIRVLGSHGSDLLIQGPNGSTICRSVGFLVNDELMVDAGTLASGLTLEEQIRVKHILLSHLHLDHIKGIPPLVDNLSGLVDHQVVVASLSSVVAGLQKHVFNDMVFPNFFDLQGPRHSILRARGLEAKKEVSLSGGISITPIPVNHTVETVGFVIRDDSAAWIYSGDTHHTEEIWQVAARTPNLKGVFIEVSFPDSMMDIAIQSKHLTPTLLAQEFRKIGKPDLPLFVYHMKPTVRDQIMQEIAQLEIPHVTILQEGQTLEI
ncbi:MAG: 3',5'-cyclic-nucleotide phosphodiesterase [Nitrospirota bacterium]|nr:3',5'-cyclic-nucleotide phosphodiesterase [Nitrospirota bacterium]MDH5585328.1 3',5'-cyclic-nucleotide phosphodiesterase [Nitrospirota bacterium]MDH5773817.1 3',5'-cyclic-nucleotide phosphodiesterase [Nitrospirota bacterium]